MTLAVGKATALVERLGLFIEFEQAVRGADSLDALGFIACNQTHRFLHFDTAVLLHAARGRQRTHTVAGVSSFDASAPLLVHLEELVQHASGGDEPAAPTRLIEPHTLPAQQRDRFESLRAGKLLMIALADGQSTLVFLRQAEWLPADRQLAVQIGDVIAHAVRGLSAEATRRRTGSLLGLLPRHRTRWALALVCLAALVPIRQSVIAGGEIVAAEPQVVTAAIDGVIDEILVRPNQSVQRGELLARFDATELEHRQMRLQQERRLAEEHLRKARQLALSSAIDAPRLAELESELALLELEFAHVTDQQQRLELRADTDGIVTYSRPQDWLGRAVSTGEKIMEVAGDGRREFEIWLAVEDAIDLADGARVRFFPDAFPLQSLDGSVSNVSFFAHPGPEQTLAYRIVAALPDHGIGARLGMKGTARLYGDRIALGYYLLRKPIAAVRRTLGV